MRPDGILDRRYASAWIYCAVRPGTDEAFALVMTEASAEAMQVFLDRFAATLAPVSHAALLLDRAGWHVTKAIAVPANVSLIHLPPYSPNLNPVERVWLDMRERLLSHRLFADLLSRPSNRYRSGLCGVADGGGLKEGSDLGGAALQAAHV